MALIACSSCVRVPVGAHLSRGHMKPTRQSGQSCFSQAPFLSPYAGLHPHQSWQSSTASSARQISSKVSRRTGQVQAMLNPQDDPILNEVFKEPVAFFGGLFSGLLRLDLKEEPLRDWLEKTADAAGVKPDGNLESTADDEEGPVEIDIEIE